MGGVAVNQVLAAVEDAIEQKRRSWHLTIDCIKRTTRASRRRSKTE